MILISLPLALIAIVFGAKLLAQSQKETLGGLYKFISWFVIVLGLLMVLCDITHGFMRICHRRCDERMMNKECMMMGGGCDDGMMNCQAPMGMMYHHGVGNMNCCNGMMNCQTGNNCNGMMNCKDDGKGSSCSEGGMNAGSCPMMGEMKKMDSVKAKK